MDAAEDRVVALPYRLSVGTGVTALDSCSEGDETGDSDGEGAVPTGNREDEAEEEESDKLTTEFTAVRAVVGPGGEEGDAQRIRSRSRNSWNLRGTRGVP